ncbi:hypothetical protein PABG_06546 [Paracoccidioides brasiliensis Pb03]|nr:hypothetical protein PABG_06546 [Paracoccidioides brasiliensis Pb03]
MTSQQTQKALVDGPNGEPLVITDYPIPPLPADYVLAKTAYVSLNPLHQAHWLAAASQGRSKRSGCDDAGGFVYRRSGAVSGDPAIGFGDGALAIHFAKLSSYTVITTCSPSNFSYVKELEARIAFDYHVKDVGKKIREYTNNDLHLAYDTIGSVETAAVCSDALSSRPGGKYMATLSVRSKRKDIESDYRMGSTSFPASLEDYEFAKRFAGVAEKLVWEGKVRAHRVLLKEGGFEAIPAWWELMRKNKVSGQKKLVYRV